MITQELYPLMCVEMRVMHIRFRKVNFSQRLFFYLIFGFLFCYGFQQSFNIHLLSPGDAAVFNSHPTIAIYSDLDLENAAVSGTGDSGFPYILENWEIDTENNHGIYVTGTTNHFIIRNCTFIPNTGYSSYFGIYLNQVPEGTARIENITTKSNYHGIYLYHSDNVTITNSIAKQSLNYGLYTHYSDYTRVLNCTFQDNGVGIYVNRSPYSTIWNCFLKNDDYGIYMAYNTEYATIANNTLHENGIHFHFSTKSEGISNTVENNTVNGLPLGYIENATDTVISNPYGELVLINTTNMTVINQNCSNAAVGVFLVECVNCSVLNSTLNSNTDRGITLMRSINTTVINNVIDNNGNFGIYEELCDYSLFKNNTITNTGYCGLSVSSTFNSTVFNNTISGDSNIGLQIYYSDLTTVDQNTIHQGIQIHYSPSTITNNTLLYDGVFIEEDTLENYLSFTIGNNTVNGRPLGYFENLTEVGITGSYSQVILINCSKVSITNQICSSSGGIIIRYCPEIEVVNNTCIQNKGVGIDISDSNFAFIANNTCNENDRGIYLFRSDNSTIFNNTCTLHESPAISLEESGNATIANNTVKDNGYRGINLYKSNFTSIIYNKIFNNNYGIFLDFSNNCSISWNLIMKNDYFGVRLDSATQNNMIHHNVFVRNYYAYSTDHIQGYDDGAKNSWYDLNTEGNYWSDYSGPGSYTLDGSAGSFDPYPLEFPPVSVPNVPPYFASVPSDVTIYLGEGGQVAWLGQDPDDNPGTYIIYRNGDYYWTDDWQEDEYITVYYGAFEVGTYNLTIVISDSFFLTAADTVWVTVNPPEPPNVSSPSDITYQEGSTGHEIVWTLTDPDNKPFTYIVYKNGQQSFGDYWSSGEIVKVDVDNLGVGTYNYTIVAFDYDELFARDTVIVTVTPRQIETTETEPTRIGPIPSISPGFIIITPLLALGSLLVSKRKD